MSANAPADAGGKASRARKRRTKEEIAADKRAIAKSEASRIADMLVSTADGRAPAFLNDKRFAAARGVWNELAPLIETRQQLSSSDRLMFATLCYWTSEWMAAIDDIAANGYSMMAKATAGGTRPWRNPSVERRDTAYDYMLDLSERFGLTTLDRHKLWNKAEKGDRNDDDGDLLTRTPVTPPAGDNEDDDTPRIAPSWDEPTPVH